MTEEFTAVYRFHPLLPEQIQLYSPLNGSALSLIPLRNASFFGSHPVMEAYPTSQLWYSLGRNQGGHLTLSNYPNFLTNITLPDGYAPCLTFFLFRFSLLLLSFFHL